MARPHPSPTPAAVGTGEIRVLIVGAGLGGLACAVALRRVGVEARVFERDSARGGRAQGFAVNLEGGLRALDEIGLGEAVRRNGAACPGLEIVDARARPLCTFPSAGSYSIGRPELRDLLLEAAGAETVRWGARCVGYRVESNAVVALFEDGTEEAGDLLVGADGVRSAVREQLLGDPLDYVGVAIVGGVTAGPAAREALRSGVFDGGKLLLLERAGSFYATQFSEAGRVRWSVGRRMRWEELEMRPQDPLALREDLLRSTASWYAPIRQLIEAAELETLKLRPVCDRRPLRAAPPGRVTLLGDAAHPMTPYRGLGANLALEDAVDLARVLAPEARAKLVANGSDPVARYEATARRRGGQAQVLSRNLAELIHWQNPAARALRDTGLRLGSRVGRLVRRGRPG